MKFGEKVLFVRVKLDISQTTLADMLRVSFATINRWESGKTNPTKKDLMKFEFFCKEKNIFFEERR